MARVKNDLISRRDVYRTLDFELLSAQHEKRECKRHSAGWHRADAMCAAITDMLRLIRQWPGTKGGVR